MKRRWNLRRIATAWIGPAMLVLPACLGTRERVSISKTELPPPPPSEFRQKIDPPAEPVAPLPPKVARSGNPGDARELLAPAEAALAMVEKPVTTVEPPPMAGPAPMVGPTAANASAATRDAMPQPDPIPVVNPFRTAELATVNVAAATTLTMLSENQRLSTVPEPPLLQVLRSYLDHQPERSLDQLQAFPPENLDLVQALIPPLVRLSEGSLESATADELTVLVDQLQAAADRLRSRAALTMGAICFCQRIHKYGVYEPMPMPYRFSVGEMAELYVELRNVACVPAAGQGYRTHLSSSLELRDAANHVIWRSECDRADQTLSLRRDYYLNYRFQVPRMPDGVYTLAVQITDRPTQRSIRQSMEVHIRNRSR
ncbi:hypothetical protein [Tuwongella immobilis]|uniref:Uncharacterized protein n=1 Tax=Tuwongella immobilis TaxID=692036 RepID=A0A6C2YTM0_9BACT|nr:hypothetical protein [Tuwongella immobilis]VIP04764.1 Uncharacterized protein OS=Planctomyces limnophilus (strain ATCC 43296 / DSM 3776 / IFAM 1008 / 290) GN=Plim_2771 PE=4 SV=1 [Tuwongella immobilis]VTS06887.1 Uncharacterized protein OS=Planctomyces limnophilus (strain ATCC 43296 / DSM 3776 / IFAM 1008 / 290) GN=Plim_2771 PE=4 SV=1 [Tuwongella immobilis]